MSKYTEIFNDIVVTHLDTSGFEGLTEQQKKLAYYLGEAGMWGRYISVDQGSKHNIPLFKNLIKLLEIAPGGSELHRQTHYTLYTMFAHNGIYNYTTGEKLKLALTQEELSTMKEQAPDIVQAIEDNWFNADIKQWRTIQKDEEGLDVVASSGGNYYENLTADEVREHRKAQKETFNEEQAKAPQGFNERLYKDENGDIQRQVISINGLYGPYVQKIVENLTNAVEFAENEQQKESIETLIQFYMTGDAVDFDTHCVAWTKDKNSQIYFINGLIECYDDPLSVVSAFESVVAFNNVEETKKIKKIAENMQWFEDNLPFSKDFKNEEAKAVSGFYVKAISMAGETAPALPLGINLPNNAWIKGEHGSKSVNLENSASSRSGFEGALRKELYLPEVLPLIEKYGHKVNNLHTDLHEIAGHGSGKYLEGVKKENLESFYSILEEARADLVALYYCANPKLKEFGIYDKDVDINDAAKALYTSYLTNGAFAQLRRVSGDELTQAHFRNRQLISQWVLEKADPEKIAMVKENGKTYIKVNDVAHANQLFATLLEHVQVIKSRGDLEAAKSMVMTYATKIDQDLLKEIHERVKNLDLPNLVAFMTPVLDFDKNGNVQLTQVENFMKQQIELFKKNCQLAPAHKLKM